MEKNIRQRLKLSVVKFSYFKKNGDVRYATGTTNIDLLNELFNLNIDVEKTKHTTFNGTTPYYDFAKKGWRCFKDENFIDVIND